MEIPRLIYPSERPEPAFELRGTQSLTIQIRLLESLLGEAWFTERKHFDYTAHKRWIACKRMLARGVDFPEDRAITKDFVTATEDGINIIQCSGGDTSTFTLGSFGAYGNDKVLKKIRGVIGTKKGFDSLLIEFAFAASHMMKGHQVIPFEEDNWADFEIEIPTWEYPILVDCKKVFSNTCDNRFAKLIKKVDKQIKAVGKEAYGLAFINVTDQLPPIESLPQRDIIPSRITQIADLIAKQFGYQDSNRHVSGALLQWNYSYVQGSPLVMIPGLNEPDTSPHCLVWGMRRNLLVRHPGAYIPFPDDITLLKCESTVYSIIRSLEAQNRVIFTDLTAAFDELANRKRPES